MTTKQQRRSATITAIGLACLGGGATYGQTTLTGLEETNEAVPADHGSASAATPNIAVNWSDNWDQYAGWPNDPGSGVYQVDSDVHTIDFTPDAGWNASILALDLNVWGGGGETMVDWEVAGSVSGLLGNGSTVTADASVTTNGIGITGVDSEVLTLTLTQLSGIGSYLAMDNLVFDQVAVPEPASLAGGLAGLGLGALALRRKRN